MRNEVEVTSRFDDEGVLPKGVRFADYRSCGRSFQAAKSFQCGEVVLRETSSLYTWNVADPQIRSLVGRCKSHMVETTNPGQDQQLPDYLTAAAAAYCLGCCREEDCRDVLDMHVPELPITEETLALIEFCTTIARHCTNDPSSTHSACFADKYRSAKSIVHAVMAAKVNAHQSGQGDWNLYRHASKLAHSCDPNLMYIPLAPTVNIKPGNNHTEEGELKVFGCVFVALRDIHAGELLTFSYLGGPKLIQRHGLRQNRLQASHFFVCRCHRCEAPDFSRCLVCPACREGKLIRSTSELLQSDADCVRHGGGDSSGNGCNIGLWYCLKCGTETSDKKLKDTGVFSAEEDVESAVMELDKQGRKYKYAELQELYFRAHSDLGPWHWTCAALKRHLMLYFTVLATKARSSEAKHMVMMWGLLFLKHFNTHLLPSNDGEQFISSMLSASAVATMCRVCFGLKNYVDALSILANESLPVLEGGHKKSLAVLEKGQKSDERIGNTTETEDSDDDDDDDDEMDEASTVLELVRRLARLQRVRTETRSESENGSFQVRLEMSLPDILCANLKDLDVSLFSHFEHQKEELQSALRMPFALWEKLVAVSALKRVAAAASGRRHTANDDE